MKIRAFLRKKTKIPDGWTSTTVPLGESTLLYLKPTKSQLKEIDPDCDLSMTPYGKIPEKKPNTISKILDNIDKMSEDSKGKKYFDFDTSKFATFDNSHSNHDSASALEKNLNFGKPEPTKKHKNKYL